MTVIDRIEIDNSLDLGAGEKEAISLAKSFTDSLVIIDERKGTRLAEMLGLATIGTLNILEQADAEGLTEFHHCIKLLKATSFHVSDTVLDEAHERVRLRRLGELDSA